MAGTSLTVVVCTLDRAQLLRGCLDAILADRPDDGSVEVIVVDNGSTDDTSAVVGSLPGVELVLEPVRGLARARNTGLAAASGDLVAFIDDDARPEPGWMAALLMAHRTWPSASALGGPVRLEWCAPRPRWLVPELTPWFSAVDHGPDPRLLDGDEHLVGANLALVREHAASSGGFAVELGRVGSSLRSNEEIDLVHRMRDAGGAVAWVPTAAVRHLVPRDRMTRRWLLRRGWAQGRSDAVEARIGGGGAARRSRLVTHALLRGWWAGAQRIRRADVPSGAVVQELVRRARAMGSAL